MSRKPETDQEREIYRNAYYASRGDGNPHIVAIAYARVSVAHHRAFANQDQKSRKRVVTAQTQPDGRPAGMSDAAWNYGCTPGQFIQDDEKA